MSERKREKKCVPFTKRVTTMCRLHAWDLSRVKESITPNILWQLIICNFLSVFKRVIYSFLSVLKSQVKTTTTTRTTTTIKTTATKLCLLFLLLYIKTTTKKFRSTT